MVNETRLVDSRKGYCSVYTVKSTVYDQEAEGIYSNKKLRSLTLFLYLSHF